MNHIEPTTVTSTKRKPLKVNRLLRGKIFHRFLGHCYYCGEVLDPFGSWQIDHAIPIGQGGTHSLDNLIPSCRLCNQQKKSRTIEEFRQWKRGKHLKVIRACMESIAGLAFVDDSHVKTALVALRAIEKSAEALAIEFYGERVAPTD